MQQQPPYPYGAPQGGQYQQQQQPQQPQQPYPPTGSNQPYPGPSPYTYGTQPPAGPYGAAPYSPAGGVPPPPLGQQQYSAYPEHHRNTPPPPSGNYQGPVVGLNGWNDPPSLLSAAGKRKGGSPAPGVVGIADASGVLKGVENPVNLIVGAFTTALGAVKAGVDPSQRRMVEDTDKRIDNLFERLAGDQVGEVVLAQLVVLSNALNAKDFATANGCIMTLMTSSFDHEGKWMVGAKRLVEMYSRMR
ncbi:hypothetical protein BDK51DRAFT_32073 [Blyttiomyces helicus]|uniref:Uncharacterized protein n=1 Tax=Blyttiomyces helicus TaxID=388810 RepID=A0A4P9WGF5_9FUNG|nr:hypothetical protein BDK51DRAFT_32073 [Blyttiomyces helicus]|eukprot:RKO91784.1 hypothetical protein BDK51DRAFT_32073 [Blyttiomyces helicus]